ncbi:MAG: hypothetical protein US61_C0042G0005 [Parcubacteria group bacterium GW2011_GWE2_37_8]|nr:MAG: hypothetical protein US61_C0042G0005 [Parcubacteria group bacterium GW2011_GWE2_37_8]
MINEILKIGDEIKTAFSKAPFCVTEVGKHYARAEGARGRKLFISQNVNSGRLYATDIKNKKECEFFI